jgi:hypothetical protein
MLGIVPVSPSQRDKQFCALYKGEIEVCMIDFSMALIQSMRVEKSKICRVIAPLLPTIGTVVATDSSQGRISEKG